MGKKQQHINKVCPVGGNNCFECPLPDCKLPSSYSNAMAINRTAYEDKALFEGKKPKLTDKQKETWKYAGRFEKQLLYKQSLG